jgi:hypothetical protein
MSKLHINYGQSFMAHFHDTSKMKVELKRRENNEKTNFTQRKMSNGITANISVNMGAKNSSNQVNT